MTDIDALARRVRGSLSSFQAHRVEAALTLLVATAKEAEEWRDIAPPELGTPGLFRMHVDCLEEAHGEAVEDAERAERELQKARLRVDALIEDRSGQEWRKRAEAAEADNRAMQQEADEMEARVAALTEAVEAWDATLSSYCDGTERDAVRAALPSCSPKEGT